MCDISQANQKNINAMKFLIFNDSYIFWEAKKKNTTKSLIFEKKKINVVFLILE